MVILVTFESLRAILAFWFDLTHQCGWSTHCARNAETEESGQSTILAAKLLRAKLDGSMLVCAPFGRNW